MELMTSFLLDRRNILTDQLDHHNQVIGTEQSFNLAVCELFVCYLSHYDVFHLRVSSSQSHAPEERLLQHY